MFSIFSGTYLALNDSFPLHPPLQMGAREGTPGFNEASAQSPSC